ncbi:MAG: hypothetical protein ACR2M1_13910 [Gemmatimonadaceae bacterium]
MDAELLANTSRIVQAVMSAYFPGLDPLDAEKVYVELCILLVLIGIALRVRWQLRQPPRRQHRPEQRASRPPERPGVTQSINSASLGRQQRVTSERSGKDNRKKRESPPKLIYDEDRTDGKSQAF